MRKTKIVCTLGPATDNEKVLKQMMLSGMNIARFNFSHQTHDDHKKRIDLLKKLRGELDLPIAALLDTKGPEIRIGLFENGSVILKEGQDFTLTTREVTGTSEIVSISYKGLPGDVSAGKHILIDDGLIDMTVENVNGTDIICKVLNSGKISNNKGVNLPGTFLSLPFISEKDRSDIIFGIKNDFDFVAASFTRSVADVIAIRSVLENNGGDNIRIIAKIENAEGVRNLDEILKAADGIMVARGDMGVEIPYEEIPKLQKLLIKKAYNAGKLVITATQMLDSMTQNPRPTRAEVTDVANAIYDGTSAIMLSGETAAGKYPVESVKAMSRIACYTEADIDYKKMLATRNLDDTPNVTNAISHATCTTAHDLGAAAILTVTKSGQTARFISKFRPSCPIIGCTPDPKVYRQLNLSWGVVPVMTKENKSTDALFDDAVSSSVKKDLLSNGDLVVITAGVPLGISGTTNLMKVQIVGDALVFGHGIVHSSVCGNLCVAANEEDAEKNFKPGDILVISATSNNLMHLIKKSSGLITEKDGASSHAAVVGLTLDLPVIVGAANATKILKSGTTVILDATRGIVFSGSKNSEM